VYSQVDLVSVIQSGTAVAVDIGRRPAATQSNHITIIVSIVLSFIGLFAACGMLYYARQLSRWTRQQLYPSPAYVTGQALWYTRMPSRIEMELKLINPGGSLITILVLALRQWNGKKVDLSRRFDARISPWHDHQFTLLLPFSQLPDGTDWGKLKAQLGSKGDGIRIAVEVKYLTGPSGRTIRTLTLRFRLWGILPAADGSLIGIEQTSCRAVNSTGNSGDTYPISADRCA